LHFAASFLGPKLELSPEILLEAKNFIHHNAHGVFVWVHLVARQLVKYGERGYTKQGIIDFLNSLPTELEELYIRILKELEQRDKTDIQDGQKMFQLVLFARRPLRLAEVHQALAVPDHDDLDIGDAFSCSDASFENALIYGLRKRIIHCGGNFLEIKGIPGICFPPRVNLVEAIRLT
jgi:hypothetical protein